MGWWYNDFKPYVPVAQRRALALKEIAKRLKKGQTASPVVIPGRKIVTTFWGNAWCTNLESYSDFANRLPRGRTYVRNGSVMHLSIDKGRITAWVSGSELYTIEIEITTLPLKTWQAVKKRCAGKIGSLVELLKGKLSNAVMEAVTDRAEGLFPKPSEIKMSCSCPDYAGMCKHLAAVMYGIGARLDSKPELLFELRGVDHQELIEQAIPDSLSIRAKEGTPTIDMSELGAIFDIEIDDTSVEKPASKKRERPKAARKVKQEPAPSKRAAKPKKVEKQAAPLKKAATKKASVTRPKRGTKQAETEKQAAPLKKAARKSPRATKQVVAEEKPQTEKRKAAPKKSTRSGKTPKAASKPRSARVSKKG